MKNTLSVCLLAVTLVSPATLFAQSTGQGGASAKELQKGISVELPLSRTASLMPEADNPDAWIVSVTNDGRIYFGVERATSAGLLQKMESRPRNRDQKLYIKADMRTPFRNLQGVLRDARAVYFQTVVFLTAQADVADTGVPVSPKGLEIAIRNLITRREPAVVVTLVRSEDGSTRVRVNNRDTDRDNLTSTLSESLNDEKNEKDATILVSADLRLPFSEVAQVIDACRSIPVKTVLLVP